MELRIRGGRAVLAGPGGPAAREVDPRNLAIDADLADALHEWARVASAVRRSGRDPADGGDVVSQRGRQLATRVAAVMGTSVRYVDPVTGAETVVEPPDHGVPEPSVSVAEKLLGPQEPEPTPWFTGLTVSVFVALVIIVAMLALAGTLAKETSGILAVLASVVVTAGLAPSLWLIRRTPILRWVALGAAAGAVVSWIGVLVVVF